jgi:hypothetical protein
MILKHRDAFILHSEDTRLPWPIQKERSRYHNYHIDLELDRGIMDFFCLRDHQAGGPGFPSPAPYGPTTSYATVCIALWVFGAHKPNLITIRWDTIKEVNDFVVLNKCTD